MRFAEMGKWQDITFNGDGLPFFHLIIWLIKTADVGSYNLLSYTGKLITG